MIIETIKSKYMRGIMDQNTYVVMNKKEAVIVDAGAELGDIKDIVGDRKVLAVLITHLHFDHIWNIDEYVREFECDVYAKSGAEEKFSDANLNGSFLVRQSITKNIDKKYIKYYPEDAQKLTLGKFEFVVYHTPGHSSDCVCLKIDEHLFTGDTVFKYSIGRIDLYDSSESEMKKSLEKIKDIDFEFAYPGHDADATKNEIKKIISYYL